MTKDEASASEKYALDKVRDDLISGFFKDIAAESYFPHENQETATVVSELNKIADKYGLEITRLSYNIETATVINMLSDIDKLDLSPLNGDGLLRWPPLIREANDKFVTASNTFVSDTVESAEMAAASKLAPELRKQLEELFKELFAHAVLNKDAEIIKLHTTIDELVDSFK
jgi:hypothetical protein